MTENNIKVCPYLSSTPYFVGCDNGKIMLLPQKVTCEYICSAWENNRCTRLSDATTTCNCKEAAPNV